MLLFSVFAIAVVVPATSTVIVEVKGGGCCHSMGNPLLVAYV